MLSVSYNSIKYAYLKNVRGRYRKLYLILLCVHNQNTEPACLMFIFKDLSYSIPESLSKSFTKIYPRFSSFNIPIIYI